MDLYNYHEMRSLQQQRIMAGLHDEDVLKELRSEGSAIALFRSIHPHLPIDRSKLEDHILILKQVLQKSESVALTLAARARLAMLLSYRNQLSRSLMQVQELTGFLEQDLEDLRQKYRADPFSREAEYYLLQALIYRHSNLLEHKQTLKLCSEANVIAEMIHEDFVVLAHSQYCVHLYHQDLYLDSWKSFESNFVLEEVDPKRLALAKAMVVCHVNLMNPEVAFRVLDVWEPLLGVKAADYYRNWIRLLYCLGGHDFDFKAVVPSNTQHYIIDALKLVVGTHELITSRKNLPAMFAELNKALVVINSQNTANVPNNKLVHWIKGYIYYKLHKYSLAQGYLDKIKLDNPQDVLMNLYTLALQVEVLTSPGFSGLRNNATRHQIELYNMLMSMGQQSKSIKAQALEALHRWLPSVPALLSVLYPDDLDLAPYRANIINFNQDNMAYQVVLPSTFAYQVFIRELLLKPETVLTSQPNSKMIKQRDLLFIQYGNLKYFRKPTTIGKLIHMIVVLQPPNQGFLLRQLLEEFGLPTKSKSNYETYMISRLTHMLNQLVNEEVTLSEFQSELIKLS